MLTGRRSILHERAVSSFLCGSKKVTWRITASETGICTRATGNLLRLNPVRVGAATTSQLKWKSTERLDRSHSLSLDSNGSLNVFPMDNSPKPFFPNVMDSLKKRNSKEETDDFDNYELAFQHSDSWKLARGWLVLSLCGFTPLVSNAESLLKLSKKVFGATLVNAVIKPSFFGHFCAGEDKQEVERVVEQLGAIGIAPILFYSAEAEPDEANTPMNKTTQQHDNFLAIQQQLSLSSEVSPGGFSPIKLSCFCEPAVILAISKALQSQETPLGMRPCLDRNHQEGGAKEQFCSQLEDQLREMQVLTDADDDFQASVRSAIEYCGEIGRTAQALNVKVLVDAEHFCYQPAIDLVAYYLQKHFNKGEDTFFLNTFQCYLKQTDENIDRFLELSMAEGFNFGAKLVRGAYIDYESRAAAKHGRPSPVHDSIEETHNCYKRNVSKLLTRIKRRSESEIHYEVMLGTHNKESVKQVLELVSENELSEAQRSKIHVAQLYGMADNLTNIAAKKNLNALKLLPYGPVEEVMPYLLRRAQENNSMLGNAAYERQMIFNELKRRVVGF